MTTFARKRLAAGLTQSQLAKRLRVKQHTVSTWERAESTPSPEYIPKLARIFRVTPDEVVSLFDKSVVTSAGKD